MYLARIFLGLGLSMTGALQHLHGAEFQNAPKPRQLKVDVHRLAPLVITNSESKVVKGFEIDLLRRIARDSNFELEFRIIDNFEDIFNGVKSNSADVAVAGISILEAREQNLDFSVPTVHGSLSLLTPAPSVSLGDRLKVWAAHTYPILGMIALVFLSALASFLSERKTDPETTYVREWWESAFFCSTLNFVSNPPKTNTARTILLISGFSVIGLVTWQTALFTRLVEYDYSETSIKRNADLAHRQIATVKGSSSVALGRNLEAQVVEVDSLEGAVDLLRSSKVDAVLFDTIELKYLVGQDKRFRILGSVREEDYGFVFPQGSELRETMNRSLLRLRESGEYDEIKSKYSSIR